MTKLDKIMIDIPVTESLTQSCTAGKRPGERK